jgi:hypothetical protein
MLLTGDEKLKQRVRQVVLSRLLRAVFYVIETLAFFHHELRVRNRREWLMWRTEPHRYPFCSKMTDRSSNCLNISSSSRLRVLSSIVLTRNRVGRHSKLQYCPTRGTSFLGRMLTNSTIPMATPSSTMNEGIQTSEHLGPLQGSCVEPRMMSSQLLVLFTKWPNPPIPRRMMPT